jgi:hypothetical protein
MKVSLCQKRIAGISSSPSPYPPLRPPPTSHPNPTNPFPSASKFPSLPNPATLHLSHISSYPSLLNYSPPSLKYLKWSLARRAVRHERRSLQRDLPQSLPRHSINPPRAPLSRSRTSRRARARRLSFGRHSGMSSIPTRRMSTARELHGVAVLQTRDLAVVLSKWRDVRGGAAGGRRACGAAGAEAGCAAHGAWTGAGVRVVGMGVEAAGCGEGGGVAGYGDGVAEMVRGFVGLEVRGEE